MPVSTMLHTVAKPMLPSGTWISPRKPPSGATATSSLTHMPLSKAVFIPFRASLKASFGKNDTLMGTMPLPALASKVVL